MQKAKKAQIANKPQSAEVKSASPLALGNDTKQHIPATMESIFGSISWLMLQSPAHRYLFISDYSSACHMPVGKFPARTGGRSRF